MVEYTSHLLRAWLADAAPTDLVRLTAHWIDRAVSYPDQGYCEDPGLTGDGVVDALVAAAVETVSLRRGDFSPQWTSGPERFLTTVWHPGPPGMLAWSFAHAPGSFKVRGLLVESDSLRCA